MNYNENRSKTGPSKHCRPVGAMIGGVLDAQHIRAMCLHRIGVTITRMQLTGQRGAFTVAKTIVHTEETMALYKGNPFAVYLAIKHSSRWYFNELFRSLLADPAGKVSVTSGLIAGLGSGITEAVLMVTPFEAINIRLQIHKGMEDLPLKYKGSIFQTVKTIFKEEGVTALWKGNVPTMVRQGVNQMLLFGTYDLGKMYFYGDRDAKIGVGSAAALGLVAGALGPMCNNPVDVCKTRLMAQVTVPGEQPRYTGMRQCIAKIYKEEGARVLMSGCLLRIIRIAPGMAITFAIIEWCLPRT